MKYLYIIAVLFTFPLTIAQTNRPPTPPQNSRPPIIDMHLHALPADFFSKAGLPNPVTGKPSANTSDDALLRATLEAMERHNIIKAVTSGPLDVVKRWKAAAPTRIIASPLFPIGKSTSPKIDFLRAEYLAGRLGAMGEIGVQYEGLSPSDPQLEAYLALAEELDIPVGIHMGLGPPGAAYQGFPKYRMTLSNPLLLEEVLIRHPKLRIYVMHAGWPMLDQMIGLLWAHPQVYVDVAVIDWAIERKEFHTYLRRLVEAGFGKRIMFGSDQMVWPEAIGMAIEGIESATFLTAEQKRDIFYNNAARFLRLEK